MLLDDNIELADNKIYATQSMVYLLEHDWDISCESFRLPPFVAQTDALPCIGTS